MYVGKQVSRKIIIKFEISKMSVLRNWVNKIDYGGTILNYLLKIIKLRYSVSDS